MFDNKTKIISGPHVPPIYNSTVSLGHVMLHCLSRNPSFICQMNYDDGSEISCKEMKLLSIRAAQSLTKFGLKFNDDVGFLVRNTKFVLPVVIGCFTMGFPISPIDIMCMDEVFESFIECVKPKIWFCENDLVKALDSLLKSNNCKAQIVAMGQRMEGYLHVADFLKETGEEDEFISLNVCGDCGNHPDCVKDQLFFICSPPEFEDNSKACLAIYATSGSTDTPKSVAISHAQFIDCSYVSHWNMDSDQVFYSPVPVSWISGLYAISAFIFHGCKRVITVNMTDFNLIADLIEKYQVTQMLSAPTITLKLAEHLNSINSLHKLASLELIIMGGSTVTIQMREKLNQFISAEIAVLYGCTEPACVISVYRPEGEVSHSVGKMVANVKAKIVDPDGKPLNLHEKGEIVLKTRYQFLGYCGKEEKTKEVLSEDGWYSTGDVGYFDENLNLFISGRLGECLKYDGIYQIFDDVEIFINEMEWVERCAIVGIPDENKGNDIPAIVIVKKEDYLTKSDVLIFLEKHFPEKRKIFNEVFFMESFPVTKSTGKLKKYLVKKFATEQMARTGRLRM